MSIGGVSAMARPVDVTSEWAPVIWGWLQADPVASLDDYGPRNVADVARDIERRHAQEWLFGFTVDDRPAGVIGAYRMTERTAMLHGVLFDPFVHGTGIPQSALRSVLARLRLEGIVKVSASYFADNRRVQRLLDRLGAMDEGYLRAQTMRGGKPVDMRLVAFFQE